MGLWKVLRIVTNVSLIVYDIVTYPFYALFYVAINRNFRHKQIIGNAHIVTKTNTDVSYVRERGTSEIYDEIIIKAGIDNVSNAFSYSVKKYGDKNCLGTREVLGYEDQVQKNGKVLKKLKLGKYKWLSYFEVYERVISFGRGLRLLGLNFGDRIVIYAETRYEWMIACLGAFSQNMHVVTVYSNLGIQAVSHAINEAEVSVVVTSQDLLAHVYSQEISLPLVSNIIYMTDPCFLFPLVSPPSIVQINPSVKLIPFEDIVNQGRGNMNIGTEYCKAEDPAIIMYTSGSTGTPKGVVLTHKNLIATMKCLMFMVHPDDDVYIAYLPLAHVLELLSENTMLLFGIKVGYSSPNTMTDMSSKIPTGCKGDASILKPTMMCTVPLILDRIYKNINESIVKRGGIFRFLFDMAFTYKFYWYKRGHLTPICDKIVFNKIRALLGGRMKFMIVGGAPLSPETHNFIRVCLGVVLVQGYSLTETCSSGTVMNNTDTSTGHVGQPMTNIEVKLVNWEEGKYRVTDKPYPRGEIYICGDNVAHSYFKNPEKTQECFFVDPVGGKRWFRTGDIGAYDEAGFLKIIDRKKDLVKLQQGEYVSLGKVESVFKTNSLVDNICIYGEPYQEFTVAIMVPNSSNLESLAIRMGMTIQSYEHLLLDRQLIVSVLSILQAHGKTCNLKKFEIPLALVMVPELWTVESGFVTAAFKLRRREVEKYYMKSIRSMYNETVGHPTTPYQTIV